METIKQWNSGNLVYTIKSEWDKYPDLSYLGEDTDTLGPGVIVRAYDEFYERLKEDQYLPLEGQEVRGFKPHADGEPIGTERYYELGMENYRRREMIRSGIIGICILTCEILVNNRVVGLASISIESDSDFEDFVSNLVSEAEADYKTTRQAIQLSEEDTSLSDKEILKKYREFGFDEFMLVGTKGFCIDNMEDLTIAYTNSDGQAEFARVTYLAAEDNIFDAARHFIGEIIDVVPCRWYVWSNGKAGLATIQNVCRR